MQQTHFKPRLGFMLPMIVPRIGDLDWYDIKEVQKLKAVTRLQ
jgi:hypothetical protein